MNPESRTYKPKRHIRYEIYSLALILIAPLAVLSVFPYDALSFEPAAPQEAATAAARPFCSFVVLTDAQADAAVQAARASIKTAREGISRMRADLSLSEIPEESGCVADPSVRQGATPMADVPYLVMPLPDSLAAKPPFSIPADASSTNLPSAFTRENLLLFPE